MSIFNQSQKLPTWLGGLLIQLQMSIVYVGIANIAMIAVTMWYTSGQAIANEYLPFFTLRHFLGLGAVCWGLVIFIDYKFITPAKQRYLNRQVAKHKNPNLELLKKVASDVAEIKEQLNKGVVNGIR